MIAALREALDRTLLLMRDELTEDVPDETLLTALTGTEIALVADGRNLASHSAQSAFITAALLMARSGHKVHLVAPDVPLVGPQPPLKRGGIVSSLVDVGRDLLPGISFRVRPSEGEVDLQVDFGSTTSKLHAKRVISVSARPWSASLRSSVPIPWTNTDWPLGGIASGALVAVEAFKAAMWKLYGYAKNARSFADRFALTDTLDFELAPPTTPQPDNLGPLDFISGGAITNAVLYVIARILGVSATGRIVENDIGELTNLNRYALLLRSMVGVSKAHALASIDLGGVRVESVPVRYDRQTAQKIGRFAPRVLVGVDDIPTRWEVQRANPCWLGVGATSHWSSMASFHARGAACAGCLHPIDDPDNRPIPTVAFVSFWAGLLLATYFLREACGKLSPVSQQSTYLTPLRPELPWRTPVAVSERCPVGHKESHIV